MAVDEEKATREVVKNTLGMPKEVYEVYMDLESQWSILNLTKRFKERINEHLKVNTMTRDSMLK